MKVVIAEAVDWETTVRVGSHHYATYMLEEGCEVLWMSQHTHPLSWFTGKPGRMRNAFRLRHGAPQTPASPALYVPFSLLPCRRHRLLNSELVARLSPRLTIPSIPSIIRKLGFRNVDVLWISNPMFVGLADLIQHDVLVARVNDLYSGFRNLPECVGSLEKRLVDRADLVFATSRVLMRHVESYGREPIYLPNGGEFEHFSIKARVPDEYNNIPAPRVLYVGAIEHWFDTELVVRAARNLPNVSFVLIGPCSWAQANALSTAKLPNLYVLGAKPYSYLPGYCQYADAAIIPFKLNGLTQAVNPNKLYEYLAAGLPVVSTRLPEIRTFEPLVRLADGPEEFTECIRGILRSGKNDGLREQRVRYAAANSWRARFDEAWALVLSKRNGAGLPSDDLVRA